MDIVMRGLSEGEEGQELEYRRAKAGGVRHFCRRLPEVQALRRFYYFDYAQDKYAQYKVAHRRQAQGKQDKPSGSFGCAQDKCAQDKLGRSD